MGKLKPPGEVFNDWTPEQQEAYNSQLDPLYADRERNQAALYDLGDDGSPVQSGPWYDEDGNSDNSRQRQALLALDSEDHPNPADADGVAGNRLGNLFIANSSGGGYDRSLAQKASSIQFHRNRIKETNQKIDELKVEEINSSSVNHDQIKQDYVDALKAQIEADRKTLEEHNKKLKEMMDDYEEHKLRYALFDHNKHYYHIQYQIGIIQDLVKVIEFNTTNLENTAPQTPPATDPPQPQAPSAPLVQKFVSMGAKLSCPFAMGGQSSLVVQRPMCLLENSPWANIMDYKPMVNIPTFGMCNSLANPQVASATAAALGTLTPQPCIPNIVAPWQPGKMDVLVENQPALLNTSTCQCLWGGVITILP